MKKVLFICEGNAGRSQMAEAFYNHYKGKNLAISAGTADVGKKYNFTPRKDIVAVMQEKNIDISHQRIKQLTEKMIQEVKTIVVLCEPNLLPHFVLSSKLKIFFKEVNDPVNSTIEETRNIRDQIEQIVLNLIVTQTSTI